MLWLVGGLCRNFDYHVMITNDMGCSGFTVRGSRAVVSEGHSWHYRDERYGINYVLGCFLSN